MLQEAEKIHLISKLYGLLGFVSDNGQKPSQDNFYCLLGADKRLKELSDNIRFFIPLKEPEQTAYNREMLVLYKLIKMGSEADNDFPYDVQQAGRRFLRQYLFPEGEYYNLYPVEHYFKTNPLAMLTVITAVNLIEKIQNKTASYDFVFKNPKSLDALQAIYGCLIGTNNLSAIFNQTVTGKVGFNSELSDAIYHLSGKYGKVWEEIALKIDLRRKNINENKLNQDTFRLGPFYNKLSNDNRPILGSRDARLWLGKEHNDQIINSGANKFVGLKADESGNLDILLDSDGSPALIFDDDIITILATSFGQQDFIWPSIGILPTISNGNFSTLIQHNVYEPAWIANTMLGRTLYITDITAGKLVVDFDGFRIADDASIETQKMLGSLKEKIRITTDQHPANQISACINVNPDKTDINVDTFTDKMTGIKSWIVSVPNMKLKIDGGYVIQRDSAEKPVMWQHRNDPNYKCGQITASLSENFESIAKSIPVYERLRQLMAIVYAFHELKQLGFRPNEQLQSQITNAKNLLEEQASKEPNEYVRQLKQHRLAI